jgi:hypothetical protein
LEERRRIGGSALALRRHGNYHALFPGGGWPSAGLSPIDLPDGRPMSEHEPDIVVETPGTPPVPFDPPHPGSLAMPRWDGGELPPAPVFRSRNLAMLIGPGLVMGASAIGGGEWLTGPKITAQFGGSLLWLCTLSILGQVIYNIEISRYALYSGEPIFTGKFRTLPGPIFWMYVYLILDLGSILPYLASNAAIPAAAIWLGHLPDPKADVVLLKTLACVIFGSVFIPLSVGGKVYNSMKAVMTFKLITVVGFLMFLAVMFSSVDTWAEIFSGFVKFGNVPIKAASADAPNVDNVFLALWEGRSLTFDLTVVGFLASMAAISGNGGLTNTPMSNYTRDQGWGMGAHVGAIPSIVGGHAIELSHVGMVFPTDDPAQLKRWRGWLWHVMREQWCLWMPACFLGIALPSMLSVQFLPRRTVLTNDWLAAGMTADGVQKTVGNSVQDWGEAFQWVGPSFWYMTLFCGLLILGTSMASTADGVLRRWVDVFWTALPWLRKWDTRHIGRLYFGVLCVYLGFGMVMLTLVPGDKLLVMATGMLYNYALGFSCFHVLYVNRTLLPKPLRPGIVHQIGLVLGGTFFSVMAIVSTITRWGDLVKAVSETFGA